MKETKVTPKRILSLLLILVLLVGMMPTAALAAGTEDGPVVEPFSYTKDGLTFEFTPELRTGAHFVGQCLTNVHWTIKKAVDEVVVTEITSFQRYLGDAQPVGPLFSYNASDTQFEDRTYTLSDGTTKAFTPGVEIASGVFDSVYGYHYDNGTAEYYLLVTGTWYGPAAKGAQYVISDTSSFLHITFKATNFPLGYAVTYNNGGYSGVAGIPEGTFHTTGSSNENQSFKVSDVVPTLAGCTFKGWSSNEWKKTDEDGNELMGEAALFQPGDTVEKVTSDTVLTAVWKPTETANTHTVTFDVGVANAGPVPGTQTVTAGGHATEPDADPVRDDYEFEYWYLSTDTTKARYDFGNAAVNDNITLCAKWKNKQVTVTWKDRPAGALLVHDGSDQTDPDYNVMVNKGSTVNFTVKWGV